MDVQACLVYLLVSYSTDRRNPIYGFNIGVVDPVESRSIFFLFFFLGGSETDQATLKRSKKYYNILQVGSTVCLKLCYIFQNLGYLQDNLKYLMKKKHEYYLYFFQLENRFEAV